MVRGAILAAGIVAAAMGTACGQSGRAQPYELTTVSLQTLKHPDGRVAKVRTETVLRYSWHVRNGQQTLVLNSLAEKRAINGQETSSTLTTREGIRTQEAGRQVQQVSFASASPTLKQVLSETYDVPLVQLQRDAKGKLTNKSIAKPGAEETIQQGYLAPALLVQAPPPGDDDTAEWKSETQLGFGNIGFAPGALTYKANGRTEADVRVKVSGDLANKDGKIDPHAGHKLYDVKYGVTGEQTYSTKDKQWQSAKLSIATGYKFTRDDKATGHAQGTIELTMRSLSQ